MRLILSILLAVNVFRSTDSAYCHGSPGHPDYEYTKPVYELNQRLIRQSTDAEFAGHNVGGGGILYEVSEDKDKFLLMHVYGDAYEVGYWHGVLAKDAVNAFMPAVYKYLEDQAYGEVCHGDDKLNKFCLQEEFIYNVIENGLDKALDWEINATAPYTPEHVEIEMRGLADGSGVDLQLIRHIHLLGELTKAACSMFGAWDDAIKDGKGLIQLRALDWSVDGPFIDYPQVTVYHPSNPNENAFANVGFSGWVGLMTGMSDQLMGISEIGASYAGMPAFPSEDRHGYPFTWMLRDMLQFNNTGDQALKTMQDADRTCNLILGVGDGKPESQVFHGVSSDAGLLTVYNDTYLMPQYNEDDVYMEHETIPNIVYWGMDWYCPTFHKQMHDRLVANYGKIDAWSTISDIVARTNTGNMHLAVYDYNNWDMYVAFARQNKYAQGEGDPLSAWERSYTRMPMADIFQHPAPVPAPEPTQVPGSSNKVLSGLWMVIMAILYV